MRLVGLLGAACVLAGCAGSGKLATPLDGALTVQLPVSRTGVLDARARFASLFEAELRGIGWPAPALAGDWLSGSPPPAVRAEPALIEDVDRRFAEQAPHTAVLVVPGLFGDCVASQSLPFGDGRVRPAAENRTRAYDVYADLKLHSIALSAVAGRAGSAANGARLAHELRALAQRPGVRSIVVVGYSKGVPDTLHALQALESEASLPPALVAVVSVSGIVMGTPLADRYGEAYQRLGQQFDPLECSPSQGGEIESLRTDVRREWLARHPLPRRVRAYSVVVRAGSETIAAPLSPFHRQLSAIDDRNDGQVIVADSILPHSTVLAEALADHWSVALPMERHPSYWRRALASSRVFPREALFRSVLKAVVAGGPAFDPATVQGDR